MYHNSTGACVGTIKLPNIGICKVVVYKENISIPHFHIINEDLDWECYLEIFSNKYFIDSSKQKSINNDQKKIIDEWLKEEDKDYNIIRWKLNDLFKPRYFSHESKQGMLNNKQARLLDEWLRKKYDYDNHISSAVTNWDIIVDYWIAQGNPTLKIPKRYTQPDYTKLNERKYLMYHNETGACIGTIELTDIGEEFIAEMSPGGINFTRLGFCRLEVYPNEGNIPHFHIISKNDIDWECYIELFNPRYFSHGSKQGTINNKQAKLLDEWLRKKYKHDNPIFNAATNWDMLVICWSLQGNPTLDVPRRYIQPDYTKLNMPEVY